jgi:hypothetical protein
MVSNDKDTGENSENVHVKQALSAALYAAYCLLQLLTSPL